MMIQETTCRPACHFINRVNYTKTKMEDLLNKRVSIDLFLYLVKKAMRSKFL